MNKEIKTLNLMKIEPVYEILNHEFNLCVYGEIFENSYEDVVNKNIKDFLRSPESYIKGDYCFTVVSEEGLYLGSSRSSVFPIFFREIEGKIFYSLKLKDVIESSTLNHLSEEAVYQYLTYEYVTDPLTLVEGVYKVPSASYIKIEKDLSFNLVEFEKKISLCIEDDSSLLCFKDDVYKAHENRVAENSSNALLLSGGVDSCVSAIVLKDILGGNNLECFTFSTLNAEQDEFEDAKNTAKYLDLNIERIIVDPNKIIDLEDIVYNSNFFYAGAVMISEIAKKAGKGMNFFACQDTRLHTPSLNPLDKFVLTATKRQRIYFSKLMKLLSAEYFNNKFIKKVLIRGSVADDLPRYIEEHFFHKHDINLNQHALDSKFNTSLKDCIRNKISNDFGFGTRSIYNEIVSLAWHRQYSDDIQYLRSTIENYNSSCQMPWYDENLAFTSAKLPMNKATKFVRGRAGHSTKRKKVNKYILRNAFEGRLPNEILFRDKAVCITNHLYLNGLYKPYIESMKESSFLCSTIAGSKLNIRKLFDFHYNQYSGYGINDYTKVVEMQSIVALEIFCKVFKLV